MYYPETRQSGDHTKESRDQCWTVYPHRLIELGAEEVGTAEAGSLPVIEAMVLTPAPLPLVQVQLEVYAAAAHLFASKLLVVVALSYGRRGRILAESWRRKGCFCRR